MTPASASSSLRKTPSVLRVGERFTYASNASGVSGLRPRVMQTPGTRDRREEGVAVGRAEGSKVHAVTAWSCRGHGSPSFQGDGKIPRMSTEPVEVEGPRQGSRHVLVARVLLGFTLGGTVVGIVISEIDAHATGGSWTSPFSDLLLFIGFLAFPLTGYVLAIRRPENSLGWLLLGIGVAIGFGSLTASYGAYAMHGGLGGPALGGIVEAIDGPMWLPLLVPTLTFLLLLFPDGHLPSPRWRWFAWTIGAAYVLIFLFIMVGPGPLSESDFPDLQNPLGIEALRSFLDAALVVLVMIPIGILGSLLSLVLRFRRSTGIERLQLRWLLTAAAIVGILYSSILILSLGTEWEGSTTPAWLGVLQTASILSFALIPVAIGIAVLRYRLFDIDVVINRAAALRRARAVDHGRLRRDRGGRGRPRREPRRSRGLRDRGGRRGARVPAHPPAGAACGGPAGLRQARDALRGAVGVLRSRRGTPTRTRSCCRGWRPCWREAPARCAPTSGSGSMRSSLRGHLALGRARHATGVRGRRGGHADLAASRRCATRASCSARCRSRRSPRRRGDGGRGEARARPGGAGGPRVIRNVALTEQLLDHIEQLRASANALSKPRTRNGAGSSGTCTTARSSSSWRCR